MLVLASLLLSGFVCTTQAPPATVTFSEPAAPLKRLMPQLARALSQPLRVSKAIENEVLCVAVKDVAPSDLMKHIAQAVAATWITKSDGIYLSPNGNARAALEERGLEARIPAVAKAIGCLSPEALAKEAAGRKRFEETIGKQVEEQLQGADLELMQAFRAGDESDQSPDPIFYQLLGALGARTLASVPFGSRVVFSSNPTQRQLPLKGDLADWVAKCVRRYNASATKEPSNPGELLEGRWDSGWGRSPHGAIEKPVAKLDLVFAGWTSSPADLVSNCQFVLYDADGKQLATEGAMDGNRFGVTLDTFEASRNFESAAPTEPPIRLPTEIERFMAVLTNDKQDVARPTSARVQSEVQERLTKPDVVDPLAYPAELIVAAAHVRHLQLVASLPDASFEWCTSFSGEQMSPKDVLDQLAGDSYLATEVKDGWLTVSPIEYGAEPVDRAQLAKIATKFNGLTDLTLDDLIGLARIGFGEPFGSALVTPWLSAVCPMLQSLDSDEDWKLIRLYGDLDPLDRQKLEHGGQVKLASLGQEAQALADDIVFSRDGWGMWVSGIGTLAVDSEDVAAWSSEELKEYDGEAPDDFRADPTELIPRGLPNEAFLRLTTSEEQVLRPANQGTLSRDQLRDMAGRTPEKLVEQAQSQRTQQMNTDDSPRQQPVGPVQPVGYRSVQVGIHQTLHLRIYVSGRAFRAARFIVPSFQSDATYTLKTLPPELQKRYDESVAATVADGASDTYTGGAGSGPP